MLRTSVQKSVSTRQQQSKVLQTLLKGYSQLLHMRIRYLFLAEKHKIRDPYRFQPNMIK